MKKNTYTVVLNEIFENDIKTVTSNRPSTIADKSKSLKSPNENPCMVEG